LQATAGERGNSVETFAGRLQADSPALADAQTLAELTQDGPTISADFKTPAGDELLAAAAGNVTWGKRLE